MIKCKRIYEGPVPVDGFRLLIDRLWPRGVSKQKAKVDQWLKEIAPSNELRQWFNHDPAKWSEFRQRYQAELDANPEVFKQLGTIIQQHSTVTLLYAAHDQEHNNAVALSEILNTKS